MRAAGHAAVRGMRRFARRAVTLEGGVYVVAAEMANGEVVSVVAFGAPRGRLPEEVNAALVDLAQVGARVLSEPAPASPRPPSAPVVASPAGRGRLRRALRGRAGVPAAAPGARGVAAGA